MGSVGEAGEQLHVATGQASASGSKREEGPDGQESRFRLLASVQKKR